MADEILTKSGTHTLATKKKHEGSIKRRRFVSNLIIYIILTVMCFIWILPFVFIVLQSLNVDWYYAAIDSGATEIPRGGPLYGYIVPNHWGFQNYINLFTQSSFGTWYLNTFIISIFTAIIQTFMVLIMSYTLSRLRFKGRKILMNIMLILGMFPGFLTLIILYYVLKSMGLTQSGAIWGLILIYTASSGMGYYVCKGFFDTIPKSLDEAARIDGANRLQVMLKVILPLSKPIIIYTVLTAFMGPWGDFMTARYIAFGYDQSYNVAVGLWSFLTNDQIGSSYTLFCAGGVLVAIPVTILFMLLQRYYVEGVTGGAVKG